HSVRCEPAIRALHDPSVGWDAYTSHDARRVAPRGRAPVARTCWPIGRRYLSSVVSAHPDQQRVYIGRLDSADHTRILHGSYSAAIYASPSHVLSVRDASLFAMSLDDRALAAPVAPLLIAS